MCYIELNPGRARLVTLPREYRCSRFRHNGLGIPDPLVTPHPRSRSLGSSANSRRAAYGAMFDGTLDDDEMDAVRRAFKSRRHGGARSRSLTPTRISRSLTPTGRAG